MNQVEMPSQNNVLVLGAGGAIGSALVEHFANDPDIDNVFAVSRGEQSFDHSKIKPIKTDYNEHAIAVVITSLSAFSGTFSRVCICHGILHNDHVFPEKRIEDIAANSMQEVFHANTVIPALWLKFLMNILSGDRLCKLACFSARVGSIGDNRLGGWYSYRASKAALNSVLKTFAIEYKRRASNVKLIAFHPGTVKSQMSEPFRASVPEGKLFEAQYVADCLAKLMDDIECDGELSYLDYAGKAIPW